MVGISFGFDKWHLQVSKLLKYTRNLNIYYFLNEKHWLEYFQGYFASLADAHHLHSVWNFALCLTGRLTSHAYRHLQLMSPRVYDFWHRSTNCCIHGAASSHSCVRARPSGVDMKPVPSSLSGQVCDRQPDGQSVLWLLLVNVMG